MDKIFTFDSGLKFILSPNENIRSISIGLFVNNGVGCEDVGQEGISHFIEHMLFKGTKNRSAYQIVTEMDSIGAVVNAYTTKTGTCFYTKSLDDYAEKCLDILSDMFFNSIFDEKEIKREKGVVCEEINESLDDPNDVCSSLAINKFYEGHVFSKEILGNKKSVKSLTREQILNYYKKYYALNNLVISIAGNISFEEAKSLVNKYFESKKEYDSKPLDFIINNTLSKSAFVKKKKDVEQSQISIAFPSYDYYDERKYVSNIIATMFVSEMSSRLFQVIREKMGLCYSIYGGPLSYPGKGMFSIELSTTPSKSVQAIVAIRKEIDKVLSNGFTSSELLRAKEIVKSGLVFSQESTLSIMKSNGSSLMRNNYVDVTYMINSVNRITLEDVNKSFKEIFNYNQMVIATVAPDVKTNLLKVFLK